MGARPVVVFALVVGCLLGAVVAAPGAAAEPIDLENGLSESDTDDRIDVETRLSIPDSTVELEITIPAGTDVTDATGFERVDDRTYAWTESTATPSLEYEYDATVSGSHRGREGLTFVANDEWALVRTPSVGVSWRSTDTDSELVRTNTVDGEGVASTHMAYLGAYTEHTGSAAGQTFRLVVPEAAALRGDPEAILAALEAAAERLSVGPRPDVFAVAAPTAGQSWGPAGVQRGPGGDFWVRDTEALGTVENTWIHEYVHTRQRYATTDATRWTTEGMAEYYAALLAYEAGDVRYATFRDRLERGTDPGYDGVRLADPGTWAETTADYERGAQLFAHLDRRLRADADTSLDAVVAGVNRRGAELTQRRFLDAIGSAGDAEVRSDAERYTETTAAPPIASRSEHVAAFGGPDVRYSIAGTTVSGSYRTGTLDSPALVVGETLELDVVAENVGTETGEFEAELRVDGEAVAVREGRLDPGASATLRFAREFDAAGEFDLSVGPERTTVTVEEPAGIEVVGLETMPAAPMAGEAVTLRATVASAADRPAAGEVTFVVDAEAVAIEPVRVGEGTATVETTVPFEESGEYAVSAGGQRATVTVGGDAASPGTDPTGIGSHPGFGPGVALVAVLLALAAAGRNEL
ncbi:probable secreted glycoprotein [Natronomonas moolapensis 8.8.11]|uniref:Probable secreted glycoprotein n=1 Tax=Natronomonas moolapensis (strain DSM 18674 / CECT 7526 / JCM 14361 / 8.8.11) TaxID=268739 RepID=M1XLG9_NATM8|nr:Ig-like domain-containing protein [Natronomonas moolapensis]CCQ37695.1 probable secreted glycoprotein [Natronomonas moolapensis 8.8.11]